MDETELIRMPILYKIAETERERELVAHLNYRTFVEEIPQHEANEARRLIDRYDAENTYLLAMDGERLAGMLAVRDRRPFSMDAKIERFERFLPVQPKRMVEIRLLAVDPAYRRSRVLFGLIRFLDRYLERGDYDMGIISGTTRELHLYRHLGFLPFAELVGREGAWYQPMYLTRASYEASRAYRYMKRDVQFLAGPVEVAPEVERAMQARPLSHRSQAFMRMHGEVRRKLCAMSNAASVHLMLGSGTLANDAVAGQLKRYGGRGLVLVNGEFGRRLTVHARRWALPFDTLESEYGQPLHYEGVRAAAAGGKYAWLWAVHGETSTGVLNDLAQLKQVCREYGMRLAVDGVSSLGAVPTDLSGVSWASGVSGKALGAYTGLCFVFQGDEPRVSGDAQDLLPVYMDVDTYEQSAGIPFSQSSNLLAALDAALRAFETDAPYAHTASRYRSIRSAVEEMGLRVLAPREHQAPYILTIALPKELSSRELGQRMLDQGFALQFESGYLLERNWLQIASLGHLKEKDIVRMLDVLRLFVETMGKRRQLPLTKEAGPEAVAANR